MSEIKSITLGSSQGEAFNPNEAKKYTGAAVWDLKATSSQPPAPESTIVIDIKNPKPDEETVVTPGGEAVSRLTPTIVKLFVHYDGQDEGGWAMGTGWLIQDDIFVTAGHCSYDRAYGYGRATQVKSYIGYSGHQSEGSTSVQFRGVKRIATTEGWLKAAASKPYDVSFMQVDPPFSGITPVIPAETPATGIFDLGVVGYPGDKKHPKTQENGAEMYEMFRRTKFDLATQSEHMLEYMIDTFGGNSGSPVLKQSEGKSQTSIGAHVYGGTLNSASVIGQWGNNYNNYLDALGADLPNDFKIYTVPLDANKPLKAPGAASNKVIGKVPISGGAGKIAGPKPIGGTESFVGGASTGRRLGSGEEGFIDILGAVGTGISMFGGPYGAIAGVAINAAGQLLSKVTGPESLTDAPTLRQGSAERAILAEATLSAIQSGTLPSDVQESIFQDIKASAAKALPVIKKVVPHVMGAMMEPALRLALQSLQDYNKKQGNAQENDVLPATSLPVNAYTDAIDQTTNRNVEAFIGQLNESLMKNLQESAIDEDEQEGWFDIVKAGARLGQGALSVAKAGLPILVDYLNKSGGAEAFEDEIGTSPEAQYNTAFQLAKRALVADAALQAVMKLPPGQLPEGWFDNVTGIIKTIAPHVLKAAPAIAKAIDPTVGKVVSALVGQESAPVKNPRRVPSRANGLRQEASGDMVDKEATRLREPPQAHPAFGEILFTNTDKDPHLKPAEGF